MTENDRMNQSMLLCVPVEADRGLASPVCAHFGSAPAFMLVDSDGGRCRAIPNNNQHGGHGMCMPLQSLEGEPIDAMVVGGIGMGALNKLSAAGIRVYRSEHATVGEVVAAFRAGSLELMQPGMACAQRGHGHGRERKECEDGRGRNRTS
ncbi:MAG: NifB/NifX family molybdenum-iron cluster-binding protein [Deltaproteobacteria bacterium]|nr:NifB/NifX family molybdenum-iron cluster-binding protein [Deltaproteobacteria bacterium]